jgi:hypothetical protein
MCTQAVQPTFNRVTLALEVTVQGKFPLEQMKLAVSSPAPRAVMANAAFRACPRLLIAWPKSHNGALGSSSRHDVVVIVTTRLLAMCTYVQLTISARGGCRVFGLAAEYNPSNYTHLKCSPMI